MKSKNLINILIDTLIDKSKSAAKPNLPSTPMAQKFCAEVAKTLLSALTAAAKENLQFQPILEEAVKDLRTAFLVEANDTLDENWAELLQRLHGASDEEHDRRLGSVLSDFFRLDNVLASRNSLRYQIIEAITCPNEYMPEYKKHYDYVKIHHMDHRDIWEWVHSESEGRDRQSYRQLAAKKIFHLNNMLVPYDEIDLHRLGVKAATTRVKDRIKWLHGLPGPQKLTIIVGRGSHSVDGVSRLRSAIRDLMRRHDIPATTDPSNPGRILVSFEGRTSKEIGKWHCNFEIDEVWDELFAMRLADYYPSDIVK